MECKVRKSRDMIESNGSAESTGLSVFAAAVAACGTPNFHDALLSAIGRLISWDTCGLIQYSKYSVPQYLLTKNVPQKEMQYYLEGFYRLDPFYRHWRLAGAQGVLNLHRIATDTSVNAVDTTDYETAFQPRTGMLDEVGVFCSKFDGVSDDFFFLRKKPYSLDELAILDQTYEFIAALYALNLKINLNAIETGAPTAFSAGADFCAVIDRNGKTMFSSEGWEETIGRHSGLNENVTDLIRRDEADSFPFAGGYVSSQVLGDQHTLFPMGKVVLVSFGDLPETPVDLDEVLTTLYAEHLSAREMDVCRLMLRGHPTLSIAGILELSAGTVKIHKKRMYRKLDITSERELFVEVLSWLSENTGKV